MPHTRVKPDGWVEDDILQPEEATQLDINIADSAKLSSGTNVFNSNNTFNGNVTHTNNTVTQTGTGPGLAYNNLNNVNASAVNGAMIRVTSPVAHNASPIQLATGSNLIMTNSYMSVADGYIQVGSNSQLRLNTPRVYFSPATTKTIYHSAVDNITHFTQATWNAGSYVAPAWEPSVNYWMEASDPYRFGQFVIGLPELRDWYGTIDSLTVYYKLAGAARTPSGARMQVQFGSYSGQVLSGATYVNSQLPYSSYGADISHTFTGLNIALVADRFWRIRVDNEFGTGSVGGNIIYGFSIGLTNVTSKLI